MAYGRFVKKIVRKGKRYAKKRYMRKGAGYGTGVRLNKLSKDIRLIKDSLNTEKKYAQQQVVFTAAQAYGASLGGEHAGLVLPSISQGTGGVANRVGNSIKMTGLAVKFQLIAQNDNFRVAEGNFRFVIFENMDQNEGSIQGLQKLYDPNQITGLTDYNAERNLAEFKNFRILCNKRFKIPNGNTTGNATYHEPTFISRHFGLKLNHHVKYDGTSTDQISGRLHYALLFDHGNHSTSVVSTNTNIPVTAINTGYKINLVMTSWYVDN